MKKRRITTILMVGVLVGSFGTDYVYAKKEMAPKTKTLETIGFAGREWLVIGKDGSGVYSKKDSVTLLAKSMLEDYKNIPFRENGDFAQEEQIPNEYFGSTVQLKMEEMYIKTSRVLFSSCSQVTLVEFLQYYMLRWQDFRFRLPRYICCLSTC